MNILTTRSLDGRIALKTIDGKWIQVKPYSPPTQSNLRPAITQSTKLLSVIMDRLYEVRKAR